MLRLLQRISNFLARLPGLPVLIAVSLVILNLVLQFLPAWPVVGWLAQTNLLLHIGLIVGFLGFLLGDIL
ncbi:MAG: hypothetical protein GY832_44890 [Chloroflexi bacterium]|nr:hypothetical protein [Chloroflexota bacterium]